MLISTVLLRLLRAESVTLFLVGTIRCSPHRSIVGVQSRLDVSLPVVVGDIVVDWIDEVFWVGNPAKG